MPRIDGSIEIKAPRDKLFEYVSDIELQPEWAKWAKEAAVTTAEPGVVGSTYQMLMQVGPKKDRVEGIVTGYKEGHYIARRLTTGMEMTETISVVPFGDGQKVAWIIEYTPPMGAMGKMIDTLFMVRLFDQLMRDSLLILKERAEAAAAAPARRA